MIAPFCVVSRDGPVLTVTMNRPDKRNAMPSSGHAEMEKIWDDFCADPSLQVGILTGAGDKAFSAGSDLSGIEGGYDGALPRTGGCGLTHRLDRSKPIIAAVNGLAFGGGFEVLLACDLVVASEQAQFALPEVLVGAGAFGGGIPRLCRKLPYNIALELVLTGRRMAAVEAQRWGLINRLVPQDQVMAAARELAAELLRGAPLAVRNSKLVADMALAGMSLADILAAEDGEPKRQVMQSEDLREGVAAFFARRAPRWRGR